MKKSADVSRGSMLLVLTLWGVSAGVCLRAQSSQSSQLTANAELGQPNFTSSTCDNPALSPSQQLCHPVGVAVNSANGLLLVADGDNNRGLIWPSAAGFTNGQPASVVLGQPDFDIGACATSGDPPAKDPELPRYWVFGTELPRLVVNEVLAESSALPPPKPGDPPIPSDVL